MLDANATSVSNAIHDASDFAATSRSCLVAAICWIGVAWSSLRIANRLLNAEAIAVRWAGAAVIAIAFVVGMMTGLGHAGLMQEIPITVGCLVLIAVAGRYGRGHSENGKRGDLSDLAAWICVRVREGYGIAFCIAAVLVLQAVMRALRCPPLSWDSLTYHAFLPSRWVQDGGLTSFAAPGGMDGYRALPWNMELLAAFAIFPFKTDLALNLINLPIFALSSFTCYSIARQLGAKPGFAFWAPLLFCFSPPMWHLVSTQYNDVMVATLLAAGVLFLVRWHRGHRPVLLVMAGIAFGLACGTKYTALPISLAALGFLGIYILANRALRPNSKLALLVTIAAGLACGADRYVANWRDFGNPLYPFEVTIAGKTVFNGSPMHAEILRTTHRGERADDFGVLKSIFVPHRITWGPMWACILAVALLSAALRRNAKTDQATGAYDGVTIVMALLVLASLASFFLPSDGIAERTRRMYTGSSQRMLGFPMLLAACLASAAVSRFKWPAGLASIIPTAIVLLNAWNGKFTQPLSLLETGVVCLAAIVVLWLLAIPRAMNWLESIRANKLRQAIVAVLLFAISIPLANAIDHKREISRYTHYAASTDYHDIPRYLANAWRAVDDPEQPHVVALVDQRQDGPDRSIMRAALEWFFYPLLGSRHQNRVVYASVFEPVDIPSKPFFGGIQSGADQLQWLQNLERLRVDRIVITPHASPENDWITARPDVFMPISSESNVSVYSVDRRAVTAAIATFEQHETNIACQTNDTP